MLEKRYPHFKKSHFSYNMKYSTEMPSICIFVCMKMFLTAMIKDEHTSNDSLQSDCSFLLRNSMVTNTTSSFFVEIQLFACSLHRKFALFCIPYYLLYGIEIFREYVLLLDVTILVWKLKKIIMHSTFKMTF